MLAGEVLLQLLLRLYGQRNRLIEQIDKVRKCIAEEPTDTQGYVDPRAAEFFESHQGYALKPSGLRVPNRLSPEQREGLRNVISMSAHLRSPPDTQAHHLRIDTLFPAEALDRFACELLPHAPRCLRGKRARIDSVEVSTGGKDMSHAARWCAGRAGRHVLSFKRVEQVFDLIPCQLKLGNKFR